VKAECGINLFSGNPLKFLVGKMMVIIDNKGRVVIPKEIREKFGLKPGAKLQVEIRENEIVFKPKFKDPSEILAEILGDFKFSREDRRRAEQWLLHEKLS